MPRKRTPDERAALADAVITGMADAGLSCFKACEAAGVPMATFLLWVEQDSALADRYAHARDTLIERIAADTLAIADKPAADSVDVQKQRLQVDTRKWLLAKLAPKKYGDAVTLKGDRENPLPVEHRLLTPDALSKLSDAALAEIAGLEPDAG